MLLARALLKRFAAQLQIGVRNFDTGALLALQAYGWPGNVHELENRLQRALIMATGPQVTPDDLELPASGAQSPPRTATSTHTAAELDVSRPTLHDLLKKYSIER